MPNYVTNVVEITGLSADEHELFTKSLECNHGFFSSFIECPFPSGDQTINGIAIMSGRTSSWRLSNWGVKWDITAAQILGKPKGIGGKTSVLKCAFDTAWNPPVEAFKTISTLFPHARFEMDSVEEQYEFCSRYTFENGKVNGSVSSTDAQFDLIFTATPEVFDLWQVN